MGRVGKKHGTTMLVDTAREHGCHFGNSCSRAVSRASEHGLMTPVNTGSARCFCDTLYLHMFKDWARYTVPVFMGRDHGRPTLWHRCHLGEPWPPAVFMGTSPHYPWTGPVNTWHFAPDYFGQPWSRAVFTGSENRVARRPAVICIMIISYTWRTPVVAWVINTAGEQRWPKCRYL